MMPRSSVGDGKSLLRVIIIGNSGSGKTWLARRLGDVSARHITDLDDVHWLRGAHDTKRPREAAIELAAAASDDRDRASTPTHAGASKAAHAPQ